jgi:hypothetical protein
MPDRGGQRYDRSGGTTAPVVRPLRWYDHPGSVQPVQGFSFVAGGASSVMNDCCINLILLRSLLSVSIPDRC